MSQYGMEVTTPVGRIVWGHPTKPRAKLHQEGALQGKPMTDPTTGAPIMEVSFGLAIPKAEFAAHVWPTMSAEIATAYPNGLPSRFATKYKDGDVDLDKDQKPLREKEGYAGCYILAYTQRLSDTFPAPTVYKLNGAKYDQVPPDGIKCGDYVAVGTNFKCEVATGTNTPTIYVNPKIVELVGYGTALGVGAPDPTAAFGGQARALPAGASATPIGGGGAPGMPGMPSPGPLAPVAAALPGAAPMMPGAAPMPAPIAAPAPLAPPPPPPPPAPVAPAVQRPTEPHLIHAAGTPGEHWWINGAWTPAPVAAAPTLPPPAPDFVHGAGAVPQMPGMPGPR